MKKSDFKWYTLEVSAAVLLEGNSRSVVNVCCEMQEKSASSSGRTVNNVNARSMSYPLYITVDLICKDFFHI